MAQPAQCFRSERIRKRGADAASLLVRFIGTPGLLAVTLATVLLTAAGCQSRRPAEATPDAFQAQISFARWDKAHPQREKRRGCPVPAASRSQPIVLAHHVLVSDSEGNIFGDPKSGDPNSRDRKTHRHHGSFAEAFRTILGHYAEVAKPDLKAGKLPPRLLFYFNGGLNAQAEVEDQAERQIPCMLADGYYPVFFVWDTDALPSYGEQITRVYDGQLQDEAWLKARSPLLVGAHVIEGIAQEPLDAAVESRRFWNGMRRKPACTLLVRPGDLQDKRCEDERNGYLGDTVEPTCGEAQKVVFTDQPGGLDPGRSKVAAHLCADGHQTEVGKLLGYSTLWPIRLVTAPLAHGLGEATWRNYLRRTRTTVRRPVEFDLERDTGDDLVVGQTPEFARLMKDYPKGTGVFARFFEALWQYTRKDGKRLCPNSPAGLLCKASTQPTVDEKIVEALEHARITLIGHSMGGIVINELVGWFDDLPYADIVLMASAASWRDTQRIMTAYFEKLEKRLKQAHPERHDCPEELLKIPGQSPCDVRFYSLMLHPLNEVREREGYGLIPSGSLLVWIDEMYEVPMTPGDKTFGYWPTAKAGRTKFGFAAQVRTLYRVFDRPERSADEPKDHGKEYNPVTHGDFNDDRMCFWRPAFWGVNGSGWQGVYGDMPSQALRPCGVP